MAVKTTPPAHKIADTGEAVARGHAAWKRGKTEHGIAKAKDRASLIPAETVWRHLGLEN